MTGEKSRGPIHPVRIVDPRSVSYTTPTYRGNLPHIYKEGCSYFITFCLFDAASPRFSQRQQHAVIDEPEKMAESFEPTLSGSCLLKQKRLAELVQDALLHFQGERYALSAWSVMPNHVHAVVTPYDGHHLLKVLHSWKSFTAHEINRQLKRTGPVWQDETFDHLIRGPQSFEKFLAYTEHNPVAAGLVSQPELWRFSSARFRSQESG